MRSINVREEFLLLITVIAVKKTFEPKRLCPALVVFAPMPKLLLSDSDASSVPQTERMMIIETAGEEYTNLIDRTRLKQADKAFVLSRLPVELEGRREIPGDP